MKRKISLLVAIAALLPLATTLHGDDRDSKKVSELMHRKLTCSQKILEGISTNDLDKVSKNAEELVQISKDAEWLVIKTPRYEVHSLEFQRAAENLVEKAKEKNLDGATLSYVDLTLSCVKCHKYVREVRMTGILELGNQREVFP